MKRLTILLDLDDVLNNQNELWVEELRRLYNEDVLLDDITEWDMTKFYPNLNREQIYEPVASGHLVERMCPVSGSVHYTSLWHDIGHNIIVATATSYRNLPQKTTWLYQHFPWFDDRNLVMTHHKQLLCGDVLVDDGVHNLLPNEEAGFYPQYVKICMDRPWNRSFDCSKPGCYRAHNFEEIDDVIQVLSRR